MILSGRLDIFLSNINVSHVIWRCEFLGLDFSRVVGLIIIFCYLVLVVISEKRFIERIKNDAHHEKSLKTWKKTISLVRFMIVSENEKLGISRKSGRSYELTIFTKILPKTYDPFPKPDSSHSLPHPRDTGMSVFSQHSSFKFNMFLIVIIWATLGPSSGSKRY